MKRKNIFWILLANLFFLLTGCTSGQPTIRSGSLTTSRPTLPSQRKVCGPHLKKEPKSQVLQYEGKVGVWVPKRRYLCLLVRQRIALACKPACEKSLVAMQHRCSEVLTQQQRSYQDRINQIERQRLYLQIGLGAVISYGILSTAGNIYLLLSHPGL